MDRARRFCTVSLRTTSQYLALHISFPNMYPSNEAPVFKFVDWSDNIDDDAKEKLLMVGKLSIRLIQKHDNLIITVDSDTTQ